MSDDLRRNQNGVQQYKNENCENFAKNRKTRENSLEILSIYLFIYRQNCTIAQNK